MAHVTSRLWYARWIAFHVTTTCAQSQFWQTVRHPRLTPHFVLACAMYLAFQEVKMGPQHLFVDQGAIVGWNVCCLWRGRCLCTVPGSVELTCFALCLRAARCEVSRSSFKEAAFGGRASLQPADLSIAHFREHPTAVSPRSLMHVGAICGIGRSWMSSFLKKSKGERSGRHGS